jgi:hypothetical protein
MEKREVRREEYSSVAERSAGNEKGDCPIVAMIRL